MEHMNFDGLIKEISSKHNINVSAINFKQVLNDRDNRQEKESLKFQEIYNRNNRKRLFNSSVISDIDDLKQTFDQFNVTDDKQKKELLAAKKVAYRIIQGETGNFTFSGTAGAGKTMLSVSILNQIMKSTNNLTCYFASFAMLSEMNYDSLHDEGIKQDLIKAEECIKRCDVLVLDDLGSESVLRTINPDSKYPADNEAKDYVQRLLFRIADYRKSKTNIITTNNTSSELQKIYNDKIYSRLIAKKADNVVKFDSQDMRNLF